jgi:hypothetical protein
MPLPSSLPSNSQTQLSLSNRSILFTEDREANRTKIAAEVRSAAIVNFRASVGTPLGANFAP